MTTKDANKVNKKADEKTESVKKKAYFFPNENKSIMAESPEQALQILNS